MRSEQEIYKAHDMLSAIMSEEVPHPFDAEVLLGMHAALDVLCWVLEHPHNPTFPANLRKLTQYLAEGGYELVGLPERGNAPPPS